MKFTTTVKDLKAALLIVSKSVATRTSMPTLCNVLIHVEPGLATFTTTNLEIQLSTSLAIDLAEDGDMLVDLKKLREMTAGLEPKELVTLSLETIAPKPESTDEPKVIAVVETDELRYTLKPWDVAEYPAVKAITGECETLVVDQVPFKAAVDISSLVAADDDSRPVLTGLLLLKEKENLIIYGADPFRLMKTHVGIVEGSEYFECIIPAKFLKIAFDVLPKAGRVVLCHSLTRKQFSLTSGPVTMCGRLIDGTMPNLEAAIPTNTDTTVTINRAKFVKATLGASPVAKDNGNQTTFSFNGSCQVEAHNNDDQTYSVKVPCETLGADFSAIWNYIYVSEVLGKVKDETITLLLTTPKLSEYDHKTYYQRPAIIEPADKRFTYVLMPMSVNR